MLEDMDGRIPLILDGGDGGLLPDNDRHGLADAVLGGGAEVAVKQVGEKTLKLHEKRIVQTHLAQLGLDGGLAHLVEIIKIALDGHLPEQEKHDGKNNRQREDG